MACPAPCFVDAAPRNTLPTRVDTRRETDHPPRGPFVRSVLRVCRLAHRRLAQTRADTLNAQSTGNRKRGCATHLFLQGLAFCAVLAVLLCSGHCHRPSARSSSSMPARASRSSFSCTWAGRAGPRTETEKVGVAVVVTLHARGSLHVGRLLLAAKRPPSAHLRLPEPEFFFSAPTIQTMMIESS
jgi:hypothetical protein